VPLYSPKNIFSAFSLKTCFWETKSVKSVSLR
jgi:hypothetical protein